MNRVFCSWGPWQTGDKGTPLRLQELLGLELASAGIKLEGFEFLAPAGKHVSRSDAGASQLWSP